MHYTARTPRTRTPMQWTNPNAWNPKGTPGPNDHVTIPKHVPIPVAKPHEAICRTLTLFPQPLTPK